MNRQTIQKERKKHEDALDALDKLEKAIFGTTGDSNRKTPTKLTKTQQTRLLQSWKTGRYRAADLGDQYGVSRGYVYHLEKRMTARRKKKTKE